MVRIRDTRPRRTLLRNKKSTTQAPAPEAPAPAPPTRKIRDPEFAKRLQMLCDENPLVPAYNYGRLIWLRDTLVSRYGLAGTVSIETVRKWYGGEVKPRADKIKMLAAILGVDEAWLSLGIASEMSPRDQKVRDATVDGAVNVLAGLIHMNGGRPAFPEPGERRADAANIDVYGIIRGIQYGFHVSVGQQVDEDWRFVVPVNYEDAFQMGMIQVDDLTVHLLELTHEMIRERGTGKAPSIRLTLTAADVEKARIHSLRNRL